MEQGDVRLGSATLPVHEDGGWALPGGGRTLNQAEAMAIAAELAALMPKGDVPERAKSETEKRGRHRLTISRGPAKCSRIVHSRV